MRFGIAAAFSFAFVVHAEDLDPARFKSLAEEQKGLVLDVRTPGEVARGRITGASVIDFNAPRFEQRVSLLARDRPTFVYCASGGRSGQAVALMKRLGFAHAYNLQGGMRAWQSAGLPIEKDAQATANTAQGVTPAAFDALVAKEPRLLVEFQTPWCTPCQRMSPLVDKLAEAQKGKVKVLKVDLDQSEALADREKVQGVPVFVLYVDGHERARLAGEQTADALETLIKR